MKRVDLRDHECDDSYHLHKALDTVVKLEDQVDQITMMHSYTFKVSNYRSRKETEEIFRSPPFLPHPNGYEFTFVVRFNDVNSIMVVIALPPLRSADVNLEWPLDWKSFCATY